LREFLAVVPLAELEYRWTRSLRWYAASRRRRLLAELGAWRWRMRRWPPAPAPPWRGDDVLILVFNTMWGHDPDLAALALPPRCAITLDRWKYFAADAVVFHLPDLAPEVLRRLTKLPGQVWVAWYIESEIPHPLSGAVEDPFVRLARRLLELRAETRARRAKAG
jgi:hypothetical protein